MPLRRIGGRKAIDNEVATSPKQGHQKTTTLVSIYCVNTKSIESIEHYEGDIFTSIQYM